VHRIEIHFGTEHRTYALPGAWDEVTTTTLPAVAAIVGTTTDETLARIALFQALTGVPDAVILHPHLVEELVMPRPEDPRKPLQEPVGLLPQLDWAFTEPAYRNSLLPTLHHNGIDYAGPSNGLDGWILNRWCFVYTCLRNYQEAKDAAERRTTLNLFLGALYQPADQPWSNEHIERHAEALATLDPAIKAAALLNYQAIHRQLTSSYHRVFAPANPGDEASPLGVFGTVYDVAKSGVFGDIQRTEGSDLHKVMGYLEHSLHQQNQQEAEAERARIAAARAATHH